MGVRSGKLNKARWLTYEAAKMIVQQNDITSRNQYWKWHDKEKPLHLPKYPHRTYPDWGGWNDFLGVDNSFEQELDRKRKITRPYWEAVRWVQSQGYNNQYEYKEAYERGEVPDDIPKAPHKFYPEWQGWGVWLGTNVRSFIMSKSEDLNMIALCRIRNQAGNIIEIVHSADGVAALQSLCASREDLEPFKVYHVSEEEQSKVTALLEHLTRPQGGSVYLCPNIHDLLSELDSILQQYVPGS